MKNDTIIAFILGLAAGSIVTYELVRPRKTILARDKDGNLEAIIDT